MDRTHRATRIGLSEAADRLGLHYMTVYRHVRTGRVRATREGAHWTIDVRDLDALGASTTQPLRRGSARAERPVRLRERLVVGDEAGAWAVVESAMASGADPSHVYLDLVLPTLASIGEGWERGSLSVADEHRASAVVSRLIGRLGPRFARRGRTRGTVVLGGVSGEQHALPVAIVADFLRVAGFEPMELGVNTPASSFVDACAHADRLVAVLIGITTSGLDEALAEVLAALRAARVRAPLLVGGGAIGTRARALELGADEWSGRDVSDVIDAVTKIARSRAASNATSTTAS